MNPLRPILRVAVGCAAIVVILRARHLYIANGVGLRGGTGARVLQIANDGAGKLR